MNEPVTQATERDGFAPRGAPTRARASRGFTVHVDRLGELVWWGFVAIMVTWTVSYVQWPFSMDHGNIAWVGDAIVSGGIPYRDAWDVKGPFAHYLFALIQLLFGRNQWGIRLFDVIAVIIGAVCIARVVRPYTGTVGRRSAVALYVLWYASLGHHHTAQPDGWAGVIIAVAAVALLWPVGSSSADDLSAASAALPSVPGAALRHGVAGALVGLCILFKPTYAAFLAMPVLHAIATFRRAAPARAAANVLASVIGAIIVIALCAWWFAAHGALDDLTDVHFVWILTSYADVDSALLSRVRTAVGLLTGREVAVALPLAIAAVAVIWRRNRAAATVLGVWAAAAALNVTAQGSFYPYHWHPLYAPLAALAGVGLDGLFRMWQRSRGGADLESGASFRRALPLAVAVVIFAGAMNEPAGHLFRWATTVVGLRDPAIYDRSEFGAYGRLTGELDHVASLVAERTRPDESVLVWGLVAGINYLGNRPSPSRFGYVQPLVDPPGTELRARWRREFLERLHTAPPVYVVSINEAACGTHPAPEVRKLMGPAEAVMRCLNDIPAVHEYVLANYTVEERIGPLEVRRLKAARRAQP